MKIELLIKPGHKLYRCNVNDGEIVEVDSKPGYRFIVEDYVAGDLYVSALNQVNAKRKFEKMINHIIDKYSV